MHRYLIKRTFPAGALDGLDEAAKNKVNAINADYRVKWIRSYATADKTVRSASTKVRANRPSVTRARPISFRWMKYSRCR